MNIFDAAGAFHFLLELLNFHCELHLLAIHQAVTAAMLTIWRPLRRRMREKTQGFINL